MNKKDMLKIAVNGEIDHHTAQGIKNNMTKLIEKSDKTDVLMDFSKVTFMDSAGIGMILGRYKQVNARGGKLYVTGVSPQVERVFKVAGLYQVIGKVD